MKVKEKLWLHTASPATQMASAMNGLNGITLHELMLMLTLCVVGDVFTANINPAVCC